MQRTSPMRSDSGESHASAHHAHAEETEVFYGLTFARTRRRVPAHDGADTGADLSPRPSINRPASLESTSTPDDTPSILVGDGDTASASASASAPASGPPAI